MKCLLLAPFLDRETPGESWSTFKWVEGVSSELQCVLLTCHSKQWYDENLESQCNRIIDFRVPKLPRILQRIDWELKPSYILFYLKTKAWLRKEENLSARFDIAHQINPLAIRYPSPLSALPLPYIIGPLAGSLNNPQGYSTEETDRGLRKLRKLDEWRLRNDPLMRSTLQRASAILGVAPYVEGLLTKNKIFPQRFYTEAETGVESLREDRPLHLPVSSPLKLLFVGRMIRTKGVIEAIAAMDLLKNEQVQLTIVGDGPELDKYKQIVAAHDLSRKISFRGRLTKAEVFQNYAQADVFVFPSFREPSGNVVFEALGFGLPVISLNYGGPGHVIDDTCGFKIEPISPEYVAGEIARSVQTLINQPLLLRQLSDGAISRVASLSHWPKKIARLLNIYKSIVQK